MFTVLKDIYGWILKLFSGAQQNLKARFEELDSCPQTPFGSMGGQLEMRKMVLPRRPLKQWDPLISQKITGSDPLSSQKGGEVAGEWKSTLASIVGRWAEAKLCDSVEPASAHELNAPSPSPVVEL